MVNVLIGIIGEDEDAIEVMLKSFSHFMPEIIVAIVKSGHEKKLQKLEKETKKFGIEVKSKVVSKVLELEEVFTQIKYFTDYYKNDSIVINVDCDYMSSCLALSSAFVNGVLAIGILKDKLITYPIMKFSYYNAINDKKMELLEIIFKQKEIESMESLSKISKLSLPLIAYHLKGNRATKGLIDMNLVEIEKKKGINMIKLTDLGKLIVKNTVDISENCQVKIQ